MIKRKVQLLVILGPTATSKTDIALFLAKKFKGELIACDSRQVYRGLDIGTGKYPNKNSKCSTSRTASRNEIRNSKLKKQNGYWEIDGVKIWMYDVVNIEKQYSVADYVKDVDRVIGEIRKREKLPIIVGGTGLYLKALLYGLSNLAIPVDKNLRKKLQKLSKEDLQERLTKLSPKRWNSLNESDRENPRRLIRAIELETSPRRSPYSHLPGDTTAYDVLKIGLKAPRDVLYKKINKRVYQWMDDGIIEEVKSLQKLGVSKKRFKDLGLEYAVVIDYLDGKINIDEMIEKMQTKVRQYAIRQLTWFKNPSTSSGYINWFDVTGKDYQDKVEKLISAWYHKGTNDTEN